MFTVYAFRYHWNNAGLIDSRMMSVQVAANVLLISIQGIETHCPINFQKNESEEDEIIRWLLSVAFILVIPGR